jgi:hypothetical protein
MDQSSQDGYPHPSDAVAKFLVCLNASGSKATPEGGAVAAVSRGRTARFLEAPLPQQWPSPRVGKRSMTNSRQPDFYRILPHEHINVQNGPFCVHEGRLAWPCNRAFQAKFRLHLRFTRKKAKRFSRSRIDPTSVRGCVSTRFIERSPAKWVGGSGRSALRMRSARTCDRTCFSSFIADFPSSTVKTSADGSSKSRGAAFGIFGDFAGFAYFSVTCQSKTPL